LRLFSRHNHRFGYFQTTSWLLFLNQFRFKSLHMEHSDEELEEDVKLDLDDVVSEEDVPEPTSPVAFGPTSDLSSPG
jgi:hypothetical protein